MPSRWRCVHIPPHAYHLSWCGSTRRPSVQIPLVLRRLPVLEVLLEAARQDPEGRRLTRAPRGRARPRGATVAFEQLLDGDPAAVPAEAAEPELEPERTQ